MDINILEESKNKITFELPGEGHGFCNCLKEELWKNKHTKAAGYNILHPLTGIPKVFLETDGAAPKDVLADTLKNLKKQTSALIKETKQLKA